MNESTAKLASYSAWPPGESRLAARIRSYAWEKTSLGPIDEWPAELKAMVAFVLDTSLPTALCWGSDLATLYNDAFESTLGVKADSLGRPFKDAWSEVWECVGPIAERALAGNSTLLEDVPLHVHREGQSEDAYFTFAFSPLRGATGEICGLLGTVVETTRDVMARKRLLESEKRLAADLAGMRRLYELHGRITVETDLIACLREIVTASCEFLGTDRGFIQLVNDEQRLEIAAQCGFAPDSLFLQHVSNRSSDGFFSYRRRMIVEDVATYPPLTGTIDQLVSLSEGVRASQTTPLFGPDGSLQGLLHNQFRERHRPTEEQLKLIDLLAWTAAAFVSRHKSDAALRKSEQRFRAFVTASSDVVYRMNPDWSQLSELTGKGFLADTAHPSGSWMDRYLHPDDQDRVQEVLAKAIAGKTMFEFEHRIRRIDGRPGWTLSRAVPILDEDGEITEWLGTASDITHRRRAAAVFAGQHQALEAALSGASIEASLGVLVRTTVELLGEGTQAAFYLPDEEGKTLHHVTGMSAEYAEAEGFKIGADSLVNGPVALRGEPVLTTDVMQDPRWVPWRAMAAQFDFRSCWSFPIYTDSGRLVATFAIYSKHPREATPEDRAFATLITQCAGIIIGRHTNSQLRKRAEAALRESEERLRQFGEASSDILWIRDARSLRWEYLSPAFARIYGISVNDALNARDVRAWTDLLVEEDREHALRHLDRVRNGESVVFEFRVRRPDGEIRWLRNTDFPIHDAEGRVQRIGGIGQDVTESKMYQERLEQSEERLLSAVEVGRLGLWDWDLRSGNIHWSDEHFRLLGYAVNEVVPSYEAWAARVHPDDLPSTDHEMRAAMRSHREYIREFRAVRPDGSIRWLLSRGRFFYDEDDRPVRMVGAMVDTTERREWEERQKILVAELQHRTRNLMGVVGAMAAKTARTSKDLADFRTRFRDRLNALARVQGLLSRLRDVDRVTFDDLIRSELSAIDGSNEHVVLEGPSGIRLRSSTVQTLALALHELATNAMKYGALGQPQAKLTVSWSFEPSGPGGRPWLHIDWHETGVAMPDKPGNARGSGQGRELIEKALPYQLDARTCYELGRDGVHCTISIPVSHTKPNEPAETTPA